MTRMIAGAVGLPQLLLGAAALLLLGGLGWLAVASRHEHERRATWVAAALAFGLPACLAGLALAPGSLPAIAAAGLIALVLAGAILWFLPVGSGVTPGGRTSHRVDERDIMFARGRLRPGTAEYDAYYSLRPEHQAGDDRTRELPGLMSPAAELADPIAFASAAGSFVVTEAVRPCAEGEVAPGRLERTPEQWTATVKDLVRYLGGRDVGIAALRPEHVYTHIGRGTGTWGAEVELPHRWAVAFTVEMSHEAVARAPRAGIIMESARRYVEISTIGVQVAAAIRAWGYPARAHTDGNYRVIAPLVARDAGLGDIGRMGLVMTPRLGPRVRLGAITTDLPLIPDAPANDPAMLDFCTICKKCATSCPVGAIPAGDRETHHGGRRWAISCETCFRYWAHAGTDCGTCVRVCPFSHPDTPPHALVRWAIARSGLARRLLLRLDDLFYGRCPSPQPDPPTGVPGGGGDW